MVGAETWVGKSIHFSYLIGYFFSHLGAVEGTFMAKVDELFFSGFYSNGSFTIELVGELVPLGFCSLW